MMTENHMDFFRMQFAYYKTLGEKTFDQIEDGDLFWQYNDASNSIAVIVNHLSGNMKSRWTDFLTTDGEKEWRNRDSEFEPLINTREEVINRWEEGWKCLFEALEALDDMDLNKQVYIRNQKHSILSAINRQLAHYAYHIGQLVYIGRMCAGNTWKSLSIPKGQSADFNYKKIEKGRHGGHFSEDLG